MPLQNGMQLCSFATLPQLNGPVTPYGWTKTTTKINTISKVAANLGYPQLAIDILSINWHIKLKNGHRLRDARTPLAVGTRLRLPNFMVNGKVFHALFQDGQSPTITGGYAKFDIVDRPGQFGLSRHLGYDPFKMPIAIQFEAYASNNGAPVEAAIAIMESMAGVVPHKQRVKPPPPIRVYTTDGTGKVIPVVPKNFMQTPANPTAPAWSIADIAWAGGDLHDDNGNRSRALCTLTLQQYTPLSLATASATQRQRATAPDSN